MIRILTVTAVLLLALLTGCSGSTNGAPLEIPEKSRSISELTLSEAKVTTPQLTGGDVRVLSNEQVFRLLTPGSWAVYSAAQPPTFDAYDIQLNPLSISPAGEYWVGLENATQHRWEWFGPYPSTKSLRIAPSWSPVAPAADLVYDVESSRVCIQATDYTPMLQVIFTFSHP